MYNNNILSPLIEGMDVIRDVARKQIIFEVQAPIRSRVENIVIHHQTTIIETHLSIINQIRRVFNQ